jgi:hypothetical protein
MHYSREHLALTLRRTDFREVAEEALRVLPDPVEGDQIAAFLAPYGIPWTNLSAGWAVPPKAGRTPGPAGTSGSRIAARI